MLNTHALEALCLFWTEEPRIGHSTPDVVIPGQRRGGRDPPSTCWPHILMHPRMPLVFLSTRAQCWFMVMVLSTRTPRPFSVQLPFSKSAHSMYWYGSYSTPHERTFTCPCWTSQPPSLSISPACQGLPFSTVLWYVSYSTQFGIISKLAEGIVCAFIQVIAENTK